MFVKVPNKIRSGFMGGVVTFSNTNSWVSSSDIPFRRGLIVYFNDKSIKKLSIAVLDPFTILVGKLTLLARF
jgi:hypothetical protein